MGQGSDLRISEAICENELSFRFPQKNPFPRALSPSDGARELVAARISTFKRQLNLVEICKSLDEKGSTKWKTICWERIPPSFLRCEVRLVIATVCRTTDPVFVSALVAPAWRFA